MKNKAVLRFLAAVSVAFFACVMPESPADPGNPNTPGNINAGRLTISGFQGSLQNTHAVFVFPVNVNLSHPRYVDNALSVLNPGNAGYIALGANVRLEGSRNVFDMSTWDGNPGNPTNLREWRGSGVFRAILHNPQGNPAHYDPANPVYKLATISFTNGGATVAIGAFVPVLALFDFEEDFLTEIFNHRDIGPAIRITGYTGGRTSVRIPPRIRNLPVAQIGPRAFASNRLVSVTIPDSVTGIEYRAFWNNQLADLTIPNSVTSIGERAFAGNLLTGVNIPGSVTSIGRGAFQANRLTGVTIPSSVTSISDYAFAQNELIGVVIPNSVARIGYGAFYRNHLISVTIPNSVELIRMFAFRNNRLTAVSVPGTASIDNNAFDPGVTITRR